MTKSIKHEIIYNCVCLEYAQIRGINTIRNNVKLSFQSYFYRVTRKSVTVSIRVNGENNIVFNFLSCFYPSYRT